MNILPSFSYHQKLTLPFSLIQPSDSKPEPCTPFSTPHTRAVENSGLNRSPESSLRTPLSHQARLLRGHSSRILSSRHRALISLFSVSSIHVMMFYTFLHFYSMYFKLMSGASQAYLISPININI